MMLNRYLTFFLLVSALFFSTVAFSQNKLNLDGLFLDQKKSIIDSLKITAVIVPVNIDRQLYEVSVLISIPAGSHIYGNNPDTGLTPVKLNFDTINVTPVGKTEESVPKEIFDFAIQKKILAHKEHLELKQKFTVTRLTAGNKIPMSLNFQICDQKICSLPITKHFAVSYSN